MCTPAQLPPAGTCYNHIREDSWKKFMKMLKAKCSLECKCKILENFSPAGSYIHHRLFSRDVCWVLMKSTRGRWKGEKT